MADEDDTPETTSIKSRINSWLDAHQNKLDLDLTNESIEFKQHHDNLFTSHGNVCVTLGFKDGRATKNSTIEQLRSNFNFITLDTLPVPGLDGIPSEWRILPRTPSSHVSEGVTLEQYDPSTQVLKLVIRTQFFAIYGHTPQAIVSCGSSPKGTYLQVRCNIQGTIKLNAKLDFN